MDLHTAQCTVLGPVVESGGWRVPLGQGSQRRYRKHRTVKPGLIIQTLAGIAVIDPRGNVPGKYGPTQKTVSESESRLRNLNRDKLHLASFLLRGSPLAVTGKHS